MGMKENSMCQSKKEMGLGLLEGTDLRDPVFT